MATGSVGSRRAFTLIELVVLIIIIAAISSVAVPAWSRFSERVEFEKSVRQIVDVFNWARAAAIQSGGQAVVRFDAQQGLFVATVEPPPTLTDAPVALQERAEQTSLPSAPRVTMFSERLMVTEFRSMSASGSQPVSLGGSSAADEIRFYPDGSSDAGTFTVISISGRRASVEIMPATGQPVIMEGFGSAGP